MFLDCLNKCLIAILFAFLGLFILQIFCTFFQFEKFLRLKIKSIEDQHEHKEE